MLLRWICFALLAVAMAAEECSHQEPLGTIVYFPSTRGRAEVIRLLLSANNMTWTEEHNLVKEDAGTLQLPFGQWPLWKQDNVLGTPLAQTDAITRHIGRLVGWYGTSNLEDAKIDQLLGGVESLRSKYSALVYGETFDLQAYMGLHVNASGVKQRNGGAHFQYLENLLVQDEWAVGTKPSIADAQVFDIFDMHLHLLAEAENLAALFPKLAKHHAKFVSLPGVATYLTSSLRNAPHVRK